MKLKTVISIVLAVITVGVVYSIDFRINTAAERRQQLIEAKLDSLLVIAVTQDSVNDHVEEISKAVDMLNWTRDVSPGLVCDSTAALRERQRARKATVRFVMRDSSIVIGTWADVQDRVWDIRRAEPVK